MATEKMGTDIYIYIYRIYGNMYIYVHIYIYIYIFPVRSFESFASGCKRHAHKHAHNIYFVLKTVTNVPEKNVFFRPGNNPFLPLASQMA